MTRAFEITHPLPGAGFGATVALAGADAHALVAAAEAEPQMLPRSLADHGGLLLLKGLQAIAQEPSLLLRLSQLFGPEIEDYRSTLIARNQVHTGVPEILIVSNVPPVDRPPPPLPD